MAKNVNKKVKMEDMSWDSGSTEHKDAMACGTSACCDDKACDSGGASCCSGGGKSCGMSGGCSTGYAMRSHHGHGGKALLSLSASLFFLMLTGFIGVQIWGNAWFKNIKAEITAQPYARTISVDGEGKITTKPDIARISLSVVSNGKTVQAVTMENNKKMSAVVSGLKSVGIKAEDIQTSEYSLYPQYDYNVPAPKTGELAKPPAIVGYSLSQGLDIKIRDLTKTDVVLAKSTELGVNQVGSLSFDLDDASGVKNQARTVAFQKAHEKAEQMAKAAGVGLGRVVTFSEGSSGGIMPYANFAMKSDGMAEASYAPAPAIEPGSKELMVSVSVTYEIE